MITVESAKRKLAGLQRYLESYRYNTGLNYLSGILRLYTDSYKGTEGEWRLDEALLSIKENLNESSQMKVIYHTLKVAVRFNTANKDLIAEMIIKYFPEYQKVVFEKIKDRYSLSMLLVEPANRLTKIMEDM